MRLLLLTHWSLDQSQRTLVTQEGEADILPNQDDTQREIQSLRKVMDFRVITFNKLL